jgi:hypothetical protein
VIKRTAIPQGFIPTVFLAKALFQMQFNTRPKGLGNKILNLMTLPDGAENRSNQKRF